MNREGWVKEGEAKDKIREVSYYIDDEDGKKRAEAEFNNLTQKGWRPYVCSRCNWRYIKSFSEAYGGIEKTICFSPPSDTGLSNKVEVFQ